MEVGRQNNTIDGEVFAIIHSDPSKPPGSVAILSRRSRNQTSNTMASPPQVR